MYKEKKLLQVSVLYKCEQRRYDSSLIDTLLKAMNEITKKAKEIYNHFCRIQKEVQEYTATIAKLGKKTLIWSVRTIRLKRNLSIGKVVMRRICHIIWKGRPNTYKATILYTSYNFELLIEARNE